MGFLKKLILLAVLLGGGAFLYGRGLPRESTARSSIVVTARQDSVFRLVRSIEGYPAWWSDVKAVRPLRGKRRESWEQNMGADGLVAVEVTQSIPPRKVQLRVINSEGDAPRAWGGTLTIDVLEGSAGTEVRLEEERFVESPFLRIYFKLRGSHRTVDSYLSSLGAAFGESVTPRHGR
ncbi:MAG: SRPBCC family protein [Gemmatimonadaceae bacterium]